MRRNKDDSVKHFRAVLMLCLSFAACGPVTGLAEQTDEALPNGRHPATHVVAPTYVEPTQLLTNLAARIACSLRYVSGFAEREVRADVQHYLADQLYPKWRFVATPTEHVVVEAAGYHAMAYFNGATGCTLFRRGTAPIQPLNHSDAGQPLVAGEPTANQKLDLLLRQDRLAGYDTRAMVILNGDGEILAEAYAQGFNSDTRFTGWSMSKSFTSALVGNLEYRGLLNRSANQPLFPQWADARRRISLEQLLTMTTGLSFTEDYDRKSASSDVMHNLFADSSASARPLGSPLVHQPGSHWAYSSGTSNMLSQLAFDALDKDPKKFRQYYQDHLLKPLRMESAVLEEDEQGVFFGASYVYATARSWANLGLLFLNDGEIGGHRVFSRLFAQQAKQPNASGNESRYGYQIWLNASERHPQKRWPDLPTNAFAFQGFGGQYVMVLPERRLVVVRLGWDIEYYSPNEMINRIIERFPPHGFQFDTFNFFE